MRGQRRASLASLATISVAFIFPLVACRGTTVTFDFAQSDFGWTGGFADYPADADPAFYELHSDYRNRPANLGNAKAIFTSGANHSDDLFMFIKKTLVGLAPNTVYKIIFHVEFASQDATGVGGIGGSPGDGVWLKVGATRIEPDRIIDAAGWYRMNIDIGAQSNGGADAIVIGTIAKPDDGTLDYALVQHDNASAPFYAWTNAAGQLWLLVGTDSGFEGTTSLYYSRIIVDLEPVFNPLRLSVDGPAIDLEWKIGILQAAANLFGPWTDVPNATSPWKENLSARSQKFWRVRARQP